MAVDLHIHTTASDGTLTPAEVVTEALGQGLTAIAVTDHDSVEGVAVARARAADEPIEIVSGVELSSHTAACEDVHILGYFLDISSAALSVTLEALRRQRADRADAIIGALADAGCSVCREDVETLAGDGAVGRSHIARALVAAGDAVSIDDAFRRLIGHGAPFYRPKRTLSGREALALIHACGGAAVLAHPGVNGEGALIELLDVGLDGIEAFHAEHTERQRAHYVAIAEHHGLVATGGSDFHGPGTKNAILGAGGCPPSAVDELRERSSLSRPQD